MKFLEFVLKSGEDLESPSPSTFSELADAYKLTKKVTHLIQSAVRTMDDCQEVGDGQDNFNVKFTENCRLFLQSINRYGNQTPFLWTLYGVSE